ncbi:hypothetical protein AB0H77_21895 [Streptomyces sp. NPDC050844]|uniref:hypothetical protein n=1 Tax=Streptomyces sp. NPDC050844 TaxID=3155790 RepID=UPI0033D25638
MHSTELDWAVRTTHQDIVSCADRDTATELASDKPHLTVIYRRPGHAWREVEKTPTASIATADSLVRNDRVIREDDPFPYLVDRVEEQADAVVVSYSSGDEVTYPKRQPVIVVSRD